MEREIRELIDALKSANKRVTSQRIAIYSALLKTKTHPTAQTIYDQLKPYYPRITLATVYKTLELLISLGKVKDLGFPGLKTRYEAYLIPHINLICAKCGAIEDFPDKNTMNTLASQVGASTAFQITDYRIEFYGLCKRCQSH